MALPEQLKTLESDKTKFDSFLFNLDNVSKVSKLTTAPLSIRIPQTIISLILALICKALKLTLLESSFSNLMYLLQHECLNDLQILACRSWETLWLLQLWLLLNP